MSALLEGLTPSGTRLTDELVYLKGQYRIGEASLPYFSVSIGVEDAVSLLKLARDVVFEPKEPIKLAELFQRDVDTERVRDEIVPYLERPHHLKFFNAVTVVLLPVDPSHKVVLDYYPEPLPELADEGAITIGGIQVKPLPQTDSVGSIRWSRDHVFPVIVDGQHRFTALKQAYDDPDFPWRAGLRETQIPVLLVLPHADVGYKLPAEDQLTVLQACRTVFIDLNKHAVAVPAARRYLLDDQDPVAVCMREILSDGTAGETGQDTAARIQSEQRLPLAVVNWVEGGPKFDNDEFLTSVITMYDLVRATLGRDTIPSGDDYTENRGTLERLKARLNLSTELYARLQSSVDLAERDEIPFEFSHEQLRAIGEEFRRGRGQFIWKTLATFNPYAELLRRYSEVGLLDGELENWMALDRPGRRALEASLTEQNGEEAKKPGKLAFDVWSAVKKDAPLAYQVIMQKVLIRSVNNLFTARAALAEMWQAPDIADMDFSAFHDLWMRRCNQRLAPQMGPEFRTDGSSLWDGTVVGAINKNIVFTDAAQTAGEALVAYALIAPIETWSNNPAKEAETWVRAAWKHIAKGPKSGAASIYSHFGVPLRKSMQVAVVQRYKAKDQQPPDSDKLQNEAARFLGQRLAVLVPRVLGTEGGVE